MNEIMRNFENPEFGSIRVIMIDGEPWFVLKDVCAALEIGSPHKVAERLDEDDRNQIPFTDSIGRLQETTIVNEPGLYSVFLRSDKPKSKPFRKWVTSEILPSIRKHGAYMTDDALEHAISDPDWGIGLLNALKAEKEKVRQLEVQIEDNKPKVEFASQISFSPDTISVGEMAKILNRNGVDIGRDRFFKWLRANNYLTVVGKRKNIPTQKAIDLEVLTLNETTYKKKDGTHGIGMTPRVTAKGQKYFLKIFLRKLSGRKDDDSED